MWTSAAKQCRFIHLECNATLFHDTYKRNNKSSGNKHLRCFPHCCKGHNSTGYCGSTLHVETTSQYSDLVVFAKFDLEAESMMHVGSVVQVQAFDQPHFLKGHRVERATALGHPTGSQVYEINTKRNSWHYGWVSSRFVKSTVMHQMKVFFMLPFDAGGGSLLCVDILCSTSFKIESTRTGTKQQAKMNQLKQQQQQLPESLGDNRSKRPHLVLEDPAIYSITSPKKQPRVVAVSPVPWPSYPDSLPTSLTTVPKLPQVASQPQHQPQPQHHQQSHHHHHHHHHHQHHQQQLQQYQQFQQLQQQPALPSRSYKQEYKPSFFYPNSLTSEVVLGNDDFLDSLINGMAEEDDATPRR
ncbi:hypothetical protein AC1031_014852 [Aphanomyces cochlioides]|nr:hypothetical protein AC1031_014852 [Aphanomyces cochlioides]